MQKFKIIGISVPPVMKLVQIACICLLMLMFLSSCATLGTKPWSERSSDEKLLYFLGIYNTQYEDTIRMANKANLTETDKQIVRIKKVTLIKMDIVLSLYKNTVMAGGTPSTEDEAKLFAFIDELVRIGGK